MPVALWAFTATLSTVSVTPPQLPQPQRELLITSAEELQSAFAAAAARPAVFLRLAGTIEIDSTFEIATDVTLRGSGDAQLVSSGPRLFQVNGGRLRLAALPPTAWVVARR